MTLQFNLEFENFKNPWLWQKASNSVYATILFRIMRVTEIDFENKKTCVMAANIDK